MEKLSLNFNWILSHSEYAKLWDFSRLRSLRLKPNHCLIEFFKCVPPSDLPKLEGFKISGEDGFWEAEDEIWKALRNHLSVFLNAIGSLKKLKLESDHVANLLDLDSLAAATRNRLEEVRIRNTSYRKYSKGRPFPISDISILQSGFPCLAYLGLNLEMNSCQVSWYPSIWLKHCQVADASENKARNVLESAFTDQISLEAGTLDFGTQRRCCSTQQGREMDYARVALEEAWDAV